MVKLSHSLYLAKPIVFPCFETMLTVSVGATYDMKFYAKKWLTMFRLPSLHPDINLIELTWSHMKRWIGIIMPRLKLKTYLDCMNKDFLKLLWA